MKRVIKFDSAEDFDYVHQGFLFGGARQQAKTMSDIRNEAKILDKFDEISAPSVDAEGKINTYPTGDPVRKYNGEGELILTETEYSLLHRYFEAVPWSTRVSRQVVKIFDSIVNAEERPDIVPVK